MKSFKIFIAAIVIILASNALSGCSSEQQEVALQMRELGMARIEAATEIQKTAEVELKEISRQGNEVELQLILHNPLKKPITSVESWLSYHPKFLKGLSFHPNQAFDLVAPYENGFHEELGLIKFGRSTTTPLIDDTIVLADLSFELISESPTMIEAYDYQYDLRGHQSVNMMRGLEPVNILFKPDSPLYTLIP